MGRSSFALFVARRYLFSRRKQTFISVISLMSILGVALGVGALVVVLGVYNGLTTDMRDKILGANAHGIVMSYQPAAFQRMPDLRERTLKVPHVTGATPFIYTECMVSANGSVKGIVLRGVDPATAPEVVTMLARLRQGAVGDLVREGLPGIIIGDELARRLGVVLGGGPRGPGLQQRHGGARGRARRRGRRRARGALGPLGLLLVPPRRRPSGRAREAPRLRGDRAVARLL